jgi:N-formylglutamate amidohydrolase
MGYSVARNDPYAGGFVTQNYGRPSSGIHALQIEINRGLYMDESTIARTPGIESLTTDLGKLIAGLTEIDARALRPPPPAFADAAQ